MSKIKVRKRKFCKICKVEYFCKKGNSEKIWNKRKYCSYKCMRKSRLTGVYRNCLECKKSFYIKKKISKKKKVGKYCSMACHRKNKSFRAEKECLFCKTVYIIKKRAYIKSKFCSKKCKDKYWDKGITPLDKLERARFSETIQKKVLRRDNYTCKICGQKGGNLQVDHIQPWAEYVELRFNMDNCRTLCMSCHYKITWGKPMPKEIKTWGHNFKII